MKRAVSRRDFLRIGGGAGAGLLVIGQIGGQLFEFPVEALAIPGGTLEPADVTKFQTPMLIPPVMPRAGSITVKGGKTVDYYEISMRQLVQQVLPAGLPATTVWGYGGKSAQSNRGLLLHHAPSLTIEAQYNRPVRVKWINELVDANGEYLPHLLPVGRLALGEVDGDHPVGMPGQQRWAAGIRVGEELEREPSLRIVGAARHRQAKLHQREQEAPLRPFETRPAGP